MEIYERVNGEWSPLNCPMTKEEVLYWLEHKEENKANFYIALYHATKFIEKEWPSDDEGNRPTLGN